jgi:cytochrome c oxidase subunit III
MSDPSERPLSTPPQAPLRLGLVLFLVSVSVMFVAVLIAYAVTRSQASWVGAGIPPGLWASTALIAALSLMMHRARRSVLDNRPRRALASLEIVFALALAFVVAQSLNWRAIHTDETMSHTLYAATFYMLTGLHALHVVGGVVPLVIVAMKTRRGEYSSSRAEPVRLLTIYWDFIGVVWLVLLVALWLGS